MSTWTFALAAGHVQKNALVNLKTNTMQGLNSRLQSMLNIPRQFH